MAEEQPCRWCSLNTASREVKVKKGGGKGRTTKVDVWWPACTSCIERLKSNNEGVETRGI